MDVVPTPEGLMIVCDVPMANRHNITAADRLAPYHSLTPTIHTDAVNRKSELRFSGTRLPCYFEV
jgi:hypothetical protein